MAEREAQVVELLLRGREEEVGLVARGVRGAVQLGLRLPGLALDVVARRHAIGVEIAGGLEQVLELHPFVAADAGHRRCAREVAVGELVDHRVLEDVLVVEHVMGKAHRLGDAAGVVDVEARAAGALLGERRAVVVELQASRRRHRSPLRPACAATTELSTPPDMATTTRVCDGGLGRPSEFSLSLVEGHDTLLELRPEYRKMRSFLKGAFHDALSASVQGLPVSHEVSAPCISKKSTVRARSRFRTGRS